MTYTNIASDRPATFKQVQAVSYSIAKKIEQSAGLDSKLFGRLAKQVQAVLLAQTGGLTHGKVQDLFKLKTVPQSIVSRLEILSEKPAPKSTKTSKPKAAKAPAKKATKSKETPTPQIQQDFDARIKALEASSVETLNKIELIQSTLETLITSIKG